MKSRKKGWYFLRRDKRNKHEKERKKERKKDRRH